MRQLRLHRAPQWNPLGLGTSAVFAVTWVYNTKRSGNFEFNNQRFLLRRVAFPREPAPEWFVIDLFEHADEAGASRDELTRALRNALAHGRFDRARLEAMAARYASKANLARVRQALA